jgi:hypothetical protein
MSTSPRHRLRWLHLGVGVLGVAVFLFTGQFMDRRLGHLEGMPDGPRALYRSAHIYILFSALLNLLLGIYVVTSYRRGVRILQYLGSTLLLIAPLLFTYGFFVETPLGTVERAMTREAIYLSLGGVLVHAVAVLLDLRNNTR